VVVVDFRRSTELLAEWLEIRAGIVSGEIQGLAVCRKDRHGAESVLYAGSYRDDPVASLSASLLMSWELTKSAEPKKAPRPRPVLAPKLPPN
jgi:hypothetical protein